MNNLQNTSGAIPMSKYTVISQPKTGFNNIRDVSLTSIQERMIPRQMATGTLRGQQSVGTKNVLVDGTNGRFFVRNDTTEQEAVLGKLPDGEIALIITKPGKTVEDVVN